MNSLKIDDHNTNISYFKDEVKNFVAERGWTKYHTPKNLIQALQIEAAELSEIFLFKNEKTLMENSSVLGSISEEVADVFIYLISLVNSLDIDLTKAFIDKMKKNNQKYSKKEFNNGTYYKK